ncbi:hypothetical protein HMN09_01424500 [Mycena chlorophos]|uniref:Uncharacterized protein n=1 Tax=Mycena chlorophos TaxID=658473 RepID=A0A8H6RWE3_MYCCL|nr:hypothetical protein HMN09_01424500 [Mycena chlorophos]
MLVFIPAIVVPMLALVVRASPALVPTRTIVQAPLRPRQTNTTEPNFPSTPSSCGVCQDNYNSIGYCIELVPVMVNSSQIIKNPGSFVDVITCACEDPFHSTYAACVDCFDQTGQQGFLQTDDPDDVITGINKVCALEAALFGAGDSSSIIPPDETSSPTDTATTPTTTPAATTPAQVTNTAGTDTAAASSPSSSNAALPSLRRPSHGSLILGVLALVFAV